MGVVCGLVWGRFLPRDASEGSERTIFWGVSRAARRFRGGRFERPPRLQPFLGSTMGLGRQHRIPLRVGSGVIHCKFFFLLYLLESSEICGPVPHATKLSSWGSRDKSSPSRMDFT